MRFPALQSRNFRLYEGGSFFALNGHWITRIVVGWLAWQLTGSASWVGLLSFFLFVPAIVTGPLFGVIMDRARLRRAAFISHGVITVATLVLFFLYAGDVLTIWNLSAVALVIGVAASAERAVRMTIVPRMVDLRTLPNAVAIHASNFNVQRLIGPAIGGLMIDRFGTGTTIFVNFIILLPFLVVLFFLDVREKEESERAQQRNFLAEFWGGAKHAAVHAVIREAMILTCVTSLTVRGVLEILPAIADGEFQRGAEGLGQMVSVGGAGALLAALIIAFRQTRQWRGIPMIGHFAVFLGVFGVTGLGLAGTWTSAMLAVAVCGFCGTMIGINMQSTIQLNVEDEYRGRVMSLWIMAGIGTSALGALLLGAAADVFGLAQTLVSGGLASAIVVAAVRFTHWRAALRDDPAD